jgi:AP-4 complex subunit epsilon-1
LSLGLGSSSSMGMESVSSGSQAGLLDLKEFPGSSPLAGLAQSWSSTASVMKGPSVKDSLQKDAKSRQVGVTPTGANPALFQDLL